VRLAGSGITKIRDERGNLFAAVNGDERAAGREAVTEERASAKLARITGRLETEAPHSLPTARMTRISSRSASRSRHARKHEITPDRRVSAHLSGSVL